MLALPAGRRATATCDVATHVWVSNQTVPSVLGGYPNVQEATRVKVLAAVEESDYHTTKTVRALVTDRSMTAGVRTLASGFYSRATPVLEVEREARQPGHTVNTATPDFLAALGVSASLGRLIPQGVDRIILTLPLVDIHNSVWAPTSVVPTITLDGSLATTADVVAVYQTMTFA